MKERKKRLLEEHVVLFSRAVFWCANIGGWEVLNRLLNELEQIKGTSLPHWIGNVDV